MKIIKKPESINVTIAGNPTISDDFIVGNFSQSNYLNIPYIFSPSSTDSFTIRIKGRILDGFNTRGHNSDLVLFDNTRSAYKGILLNINGNKKVFSSTGVNGSSWIIDGQGSTVLSLNTWYYIDYIYEPSVGIKIKLSQDKINWTTELSYSGNVQWSAISINPYMGSFTPRVSTYHDDCEIDLKECYIESNNNIVWQGVEMKYYAPRKLAPNVISIGTTSINDDLIYSKSDGTISSYIYQNIDLSNYDYTTDDIEIVTKTRYSASQTQGSIYVCANFGGSTNNFRFSTYKIGTYNDTSGIAGSIAGSGFSINYSTVKNQMYSYDWFYEKVTFDHSTHKIEVWTSLDKINWTSIGSYIQDSWIECIKEMNKIVFGVCYNTMNGMELAFTGDIDLKECYIKVNNNTIWSGMQYSNSKLYGIMPYIESNGNGQYIDLSSIYSAPQNDDIITFTAQTPDYKTIITPTDDYYYGYVVDDNSGGMNSVCLFRKYVKTNSYGTQVFGVYWTFGTSSSSSGDADNGEYGGIYKFTYSHSLGYTGWWGSNHKLKVFNENNKFTVRVWNVNMVRNNQKIFDLYATEQNGIVGMKDIISGTFLPNSGTGTLVLKY